MPSPLVSTTCCKCNAPRRVRRCDIDVNRHCGKCGRGIAARTKRKRDGTTSQYKGVTHDPSRKDGRTWYARIRVGGHLIMLGLFAVEEDAAEAYDVAAAEYFGEHATLNFPERKN